MTHTRWTVIRAATLALALLPFGGRAAEECPKNHYILSSPSGCNWVLAASLNQARVGHTATLLRDGRVLVVGGDHEMRIDPRTNVAEVAAPTAELYDPLTDTWRYAAPPHRWRQFHTATALADGRVLIAGGERDIRLGPGGQLGGSAELYDPATNTWRFTAPGRTTELPALMGSATLLEDGRVLVVGGGDIDGKMAGAEIYDPVADAWIATQAPATPRYGHTASLLPDGRVLIAAGVDDDWWGTSTATAEIFDPASGRWSPTASSVISRAGHSSTTLRDGRVVIDGGWYSTAGMNGYGFFMTLDGGEVYDPRLGTWTPMSRLQVPRFGHTTTLLADGAMLAVGGLESFGAVPSLTYGFAARAELRLADLGPSIQIGALFERRTQHTATLLLDGSILVVGGRNERLPAIASVERIGAGGLLGRAASMRNGN